jgi:hypothetical protein
MGDWVSSPLLPRLFQKENEIFFFTVSKRNGQGFSTMLVKWAFLALIVLLGISFWFVVCGQVLLNGMLIPLVVWKK